MNKESVIKLKISLTGYTGRMNQMLIHDILKHEQYELSGILTRQMPQENSDVSRPLFLNPIEAFQNADVIIDLSTPLASLNNLEAALKLHKPIVIGTTGFTPAQKEKIVNASQHIPVIFAPNTSLGIAVMRKLIVQAAKLLGSEYDIDITEMHHRYKVDAPSGTACTLAEDISQANNFTINTKADRTGPRGKKTIEFAVMRGGGVTADNSVIFAGDKEILTIQHRSLDRSLFTHGALKAALWIYDQNPGFYTMNNVLG